MYIFKDQKSIPFVAKNKLKIVNTHQSRPRIFVSKSKVQTKGQNAHAFVLFLVTSKIMECSRAFDGSCN